MNVKDLDALTRILLGLCSTLVLVQMVLLVVFTR